MRWMQPKHGDTRRRIKFACLPVSCNGESRWFEWIHLEEIYWHGFWIPNRFLEYTPKKT